MPNNSSKLVYGVGRKGDGVTRVNDKLTKAYSTWKDMIQRCYDPNYLSRKPTYINCSVCNEWLYFPNFKEWHDTNYIERFHLDKDLLIAGNRIYSTDTCLFVPPSINTLFTDCGRSRGEYPIGVSLHKRSGKFQAQLRIDGKSKCLGYFSNADEAHRAYLIAKRENIIRMATEWKEKIPTKLYDALLAKADNV